jgi:hypothetical protein
MKFNSKTLIVLIVLVGLVFGFINRNSFFNDIKKNKTEAIGKIYRIRTVARNFTGKKIYEYEFKFEGKKYKGEVRKRLSDTIKIDEFYTVMFSSKHPENNVMEFEQEYTQFTKRNLNESKTDTVYKIKKY